MLGDANVVATIAVKDIKEAKKFYGGTLGLHQGKEFPGGITYQSGMCKLFVYESQTAGTGQATCASWEVNDIVSLVESLKEKGIKFEHYDFPGVTREGDIHVMGDEKAAWFKDPDGNILALNNDHV